MRVTRSVEDGGAAGQEVPPSVPVSPSAMAVVAELVVAGGVVEQEARPSGSLTLAVPRGGVAPLVRSSACGGTGAQEAVVSPSAALEGGQAGVVAAAPDSLDRARTSSPGSGIGEMAVDRPWELSSSLDVAPVAPALVTTAGGRA